MSTKIKVRHQGIPLEITKEREGRFIIPDYTTGQRIRHVRTTEAKARDKAKEICEAMASGQSDILGLSPYESEIRGAFDALPGGIRLGRAVEIVRDCCEVLDPNEIVQACRYWKDHRPDKKFTAKRVADAITEYLGRQSRLSERRQNALNSYFKPFKKQFAARTLDEITTSDLKDFIDSRKAWKSPKTRNEVRSAIGLLFQDAQERGHVGKGVNPAKEIKREKIKQGDVGVFMPEQVRQILASLEDELALPMALWFFGSLRKENLARIQFSSLRSALKSGYLKIAANEDLKTGARSVQLEPNLRAWIAWFFQRHPDATGCVLPSPDNIDNLTRKIVRRSGVSWLDNAPRHSCVSMRIARGDNVQAIAKAAGNSLVQIERHYWNRDESISAEVAKEYFSIIPPIEENVVLMPQREAMASPLKQNRPLDNLDSSIA
jgi:hypothetical protein